MKQLLNCRVCRSTLVEVIHDFKDMPIFLWPKSAELNSNVRDDLTVFGCTQCSHIQIQNLSSNFLTKLYEGEYMNMPSPTENLVRAMYLKSLYSFDSKKILDIGGATNPSSAYFKESDYSILDPQTPIASNVIHLKGFVSSFTLNLKYYDFIFGFHTIEHLENPRSDLETLRKSLTEGGKLIIEVPNTDILALRSPYYLFFHQHINLFNKYTLLLLLNLSGFKLVNIMFASENILAVFEKETNNLNDDNLIYASNEPIKGRGITYFNALEDGLVKLIDKGKFSNVDFLGAGGSSTLFFYHCPRILKMVRYIYDSDERKIGKLLPGTQKTILTTPNTFEDKVIYLGFSSNMIEEVANHHKINFINISEILSSLS
jgi:hypothetical protein